jgi:hypothetical protein
MFQKVHATVEMLDAVEKSLLYFFSTALADILEKLFLCLSATP